MLLLYSLMEIDENTRGSFANQDSVRILKGWLLALYFADALVCCIGSLAKQQSLATVFWLLFKSLFFSYGVGLPLLMIVLRWLLPIIGLARPTPLGLLRYCVLLAGISLLMGGMLVYRLPPAARVAPMRQTGLPGPMRSLTAVGRCRQSDSEPIDRRGHGLTQFGDEDG